MALCAREGLVRRTQLLGSLAGSPDCQIYLSFSGHAAKKGQDSHPNKGGSQLTEANFKGARFPDGWPRLAVEVDIRAARHTHDALCRDKLRDIFGLAVCSASLACCCSALLSSWCELNRGQTHWADRQVTIWAAVAH